MKTKLLTVIVISLLLIIGAGGCSNGDDVNPEDYATSILSGEYEKEGFWKLSVTLNEKLLNNYGLVRFESKYLKEGDFRFVDVIPGEKRKEFKNIPLSVTEEGVVFSIDYDRSGTKMTITGLVAFGEMTVNITM